MSITVRSADGFFNAELTFPDEFPSMPPTMKFTDDLWHPNSTQSALVAQSAITFVLRSLPRRQGVHFNPSHPWRGRDERC